jgi:hypothetical protein
MNKKVVLAFVAGWLLSILLSPQTIIGVFRPRAAA